MRQIAGHAAAAGRRASVKDVCAVAVGSVQVTGAWVTLSTVSTVRVKGMMSHYPYGAARAVTGVLLLIAAAVAFWQPHVAFADSVSEVRGICSAGAGQFAEPLSRTA